MATREKAPTWPRIRKRGDSWQVDCGTVFGKRVQKSFQFRKDAQEYAEDARKERDAQKLTQRNERTNRMVRLTNLTDSQRTDTLKALEKLNGVASLCDCVDYYLKFNKPANESKTIDEVLDELLEAREKAGRRPRTLTNIRNTVGRFASTFGNKKVHEVTTPDIELWLEQNNLTGESLNTYRRQLLAFWNWAIRRGYTKHNPVEPIEVYAGDKEGLAHIFSVSEAHKLLQKAEDLEPEMVPYVALGLFAGLRPENELANLDWGNIDLEERLIRVTAATAKKRRMRYVTISDNLHDFLMPYARKEGSVYFSRRKFRRVKEAAKVEWVPDVMRHSMASYHLAMHGDPNKTALEIGHIGDVTVLFNNYRNLVKPNAAKAYWDIRPKDSKLIKLHA